MGEEHAALARATARMYADFLMRHVDLGSVSAWPRGRVDAAFHQWRTRRSWTGGIFDSTGTRFFVSIQHNIGGKGVVLEITGWK